ncbi:hypothetical protein PFTANZ_06210, partial [Plasmodium falciparum Tanzania (2000708)]
MEQASSQNGKHMPESLDDTPIEYKQTCSCELPQPPPPPLPEPAPETPKEDACKIAEEILKVEGEKSYKDLCEHKFENGKKSYPGWNCNSSIFKHGEQEGACMPPRRQKLYLNKLKEFSGGTSKTELRKAFIECATIETFFSWHKYKKEKENENTIDEDGYLSFGVEEFQKQLEGGTIPEEFKRQMFYTFGDYRDILFGKDVGNGNDIEEVKNKIKTVFQNSTDPDEQNDNEREKWWEQHGKDIWKGM